MRHRWSLGLGIVFLGQVGCFVEAGLVYLEQRNKTMLKNILAVVGAYVVSKKVYGWYQEYTVLKRDQERREAEYESQG